MSDPEYLLGVLIDAHGRPMLPAVKIRPGQRMCDISCTRQGKFVAFGILDTSASNIHVKESYPLSRSLHLYPGDTTRVRFWDTKKMGTTS